MSAWLRRRSGVEFPLAVFAVCSLAFPALAQESEPPPQADAGTETDGLAPEEAALPDASEPSAPETPLPASPPDAGPGAPVSVEPEAAPSYQTTVTGKRGATAASSVIARDHDFMLQPHPEPGEIMMAAAPGLMVERHAGGEKADMLLLRGFNADHGSDVAIFVDGVPVNLVSHAHSQGYADTHWLIPEAIESIEVNKGPYAARYGDFDTAGAINLVTRRTFEDNSVTAGGGMFGTYRGLAVASPHFEGWDPVLVAEVYGTSGPFKSSEDLMRYNIFSKVSHDLSPNATFSVAVTSYGAGWNASGLIPQREVDAGLLDRFGAIDPTEGGDAQRHSLYATLRIRGDQDDFTATAYVVHSRLTIYSDFTFYAGYTGADVPTVPTDEIEQNDVRTVVGLNAAYHLHRTWKGFSFETTVGAQARYDMIHNQLHHDVQRVRLSTLIDDDVSEGSMALFGEEDVIWAKWLRSVVGIRADYFGFDVDANPTDAGDPASHVSGVRHAARVSPKASLVATPFTDTDVFANFGVGYHSNDARGVVRLVDPVTPLTRAIGYEVGARTRLFERLDLSADFFVLDLTSEIVWLGDEGTTEAAGPTHRLGVEASARLKILPWLTADADLTWSRATFNDLPSGADAVPLSPTWVVTGGVSARHPIGVYGRLGVTYLGDRPGSEDRFLIAKGFVRFDLTLGYRHRWLEFGLTVQNLFNSRWREAQEAYASRLPNETGPASCPSGTRPSVEDGAFKGCEDIHFAPGAPINIQAFGTVHF